MPRVCKNLAAAAFILFFAGPFAQPSAVLAANGGNKMFMLAQAEYAQGSFAGQEYVNKGLEAGSRAIFAQTEFAKNRALTEQMMWFGKALPYLRAGYLQHPNEFPYIARLALAYNILGNPADELAVLADASHRLPNNAEIVFMYGQSLARTGDLLRAIQQAERLDRLGSSKASTLRTFIRMRVQQP
ncbi:hypothetical protein D3C87_1179480 [compost metagenome]